MKLFKTVDFYAQLFLIVGSILLNLAVYAITRSSFTLVMISYCVVGGWQVCSTIIHFTIPAQYKVRTRYVYLVLLIITILAGLITWQVDDDSLLFFLAVLLFWSPILAIIYFTISLREWKLLRQQPAE